MLAFAVLQPADRRGPRGLVALAPAHTHALEDGGIFCMSYPLMSRFDLLPDGDGDGRDEV
jgi:hypothetical protein